METHHHQNEVACPSARASLFERCIVIATPHLVSGPTRRPTITLLASLNGADFSVGQVGGPALRATAALVAEGVDRYVAAQGCELLSISLEPGHPLFKPISGTLGGKPLLPFQLNGRGTLHQGLRDRYAQAQSEPDADLISALCRQAGLRLSNTAVHHGDAPELLGIADELPLEGTTAARLADLKGLSASRLSHAFVEQVGMPLRTYSLWRRYRLALSRVCAGQGLSAVAHDTGFSDAAHMTNTFVKYFGFPPGYVARRCHIIRSATQ